MSRDRFCSTKGFSPVKTARAPRELYVENNREVGPKNERWFTANRSVQMSGPRVRRSAQRRPSHEHWLRDAEHAQDCRRNVQQRDLARATFGFHSRSADPQDAVGMVHAALHALGPIEQLKERQRLIRDRAV